MSSADVVITYGWNRVAYNVLRSLSKKGLKVAAGDRSLCAMAKMSRFSKGSFSYDSFYLKPKLFIEKLAEIFTELKPKVYMPMHEEIFVAAKYKDRFAGMGVTVPIMDFESLRSLHQKDMLQGIAEKFNVPVPRTFKPAAEQDLPAVWNELGRPERAVVKSLSSNSAKGVFYASTLDELKQVFGSIVREKALSKNEYPIIQEYVKGEAFGVSMLYNKGKKRASFTHKRLREKLHTGGTSTLRESSENRALEEHTERLLNGLSWHGLAMAEYKYDPESKKAWLIEVNPRFWGSIALAIKAGVDFPYLLYKMAVDGDVESVNDYKKGVRARWLLGDLMALIGSVRRERSLRGAGSFISSGSDVTDDFFWDDPLPFLAEAWYYFSKLVKTRSFNPVEESLIDLNAI